MSRSCEKEKKELFLCFKIEHLQRVSAQGKHTSSFLKMAVSVVLCLVTCILQQHLTKLWNEGDVCISSMEYFHYGYESTVGCPFIVVCVQHQLDPQQVATGQNGE